MVGVWALRFIREAMFWNISNNLEDVVRVLVGSLNITREEKIWGCRKHQHQQAPEKTRTT
jgi:hypothetical protein